MLTQLVSTRLQPSHAPGWVAIPVTQGVTAISLGPPWPSAHGQQPQSQKRFWGNKRSWNFQQRRGGHYWGSSENLTAILHWCPHATGWLWDPEQVRPLPGPLLPAAEELGACGLIHPDVLENQPYARSHVPGE